MKFQDIKKLCSNKNIRFVELSNINTDRFAAVKNLEDFFSICGDIVGYKNVYISSEEETQLLMESVYNVFPSKVAFWILEEREEELRKICKQPERENTILFSLDRQITWVQDDKLSKEDFGKLIEKIKPLERQYYEELKEAEEQKTKEIESLIEEYRQEYKDATLNKDKESIISELSGRLYSEFGIDGRSNPLYTKQMLKFKLKNLL